MRNDIDTWRREIEESQPKSRDIAWGLVIKIMMMAVIPAILAAIARY